MAKFKKRRMARFASKRWKAAKRSGTTENLLVVGLAAAAYGASREKISDWIKPVTSKVPFLGNYTDEAVLGAVGFLTAKGKMPFLKGKTAKSVGKVVYILEAARVGSGVSNGVSLGSGSSGEDYSNFDN